MTFWILLALATVLSFMSLRYINILLSAAASMGWLSLMAFNLNNPPAGITQGSTVHEWLTLVFVVVAIAVMYMWLRNRGRSESYTRVGVGEKGLEAHTTKEENITGGVNSLAEYRRTVNRALHPRRRR